MCLSHTTGSGGDEIGQLVAERLGYLYLDADIVARAAAEGGLEPRDIASEERRQPRASRLLETFAEGGGDAWTLGAAHGMEVLRPADIRALIRETIVQPAARGKVVIVSHAASYALERGPDTLRVFVTASPKTREERIAVAADGGERTQAASVIKDSDAGPRDYLKRFYSIDSEAPTAHELVVNTDQLSSGQAAED